MSFPSDRRPNLNVGKDDDLSSPNNIWHPSFISPKGPLTVGDSMMRNDTTATVVARNLLTPRNNRMLSKRSDELVVQDSLALSVQCAGSVSNMGQRLLARSQRFMALLPRFMLPSSSGVAPSVEAPENPTLALRLSGAPSTSKAPPDQ